MNFRTKLPILGLALVAITGCETDLLTEEPESFITSDTYYSTPAQLEGAALAMYGNFHDWNMFKVIYHWTFELSADQGRFHPDEPNAETQAPEYLNWTTASRESIQPWKTAYWQILRAHQVLDNIDAVEFTDSEQKVRLEAEGRFMRAFHYFWLTRAYGDVPLYLSEDEQIQVNATRTSEEEVLAQIIEDATIAAAGLPDRWSGADVGRATRGAALMLLADAYRWRANVFTNSMDDWEGVLAAAEEVINSGLYQLEADYGKIHDPGSHTRSEEIFSAIAIGNGGWFQSSLYGGVYWPRTLGEGGGGGWSVIIPTPEFYNSYVEGDYRKEATFWAQGCPVDEPVDCADPKGFTPLVGDFQEGYPHVNKYMASDRGLDFWGGGDVNVPFYRFAEAYLFAAEAENALGNPAAAAGHLNVLRARARQGTGSEARSTPADVAPLGNAAMRDLIYQERSWELSFELKRWFDMVQRGPDYFISQMNQNDPLANELGNVVAYRMRLPIPLEEIQKNPALTQNTGY